MPTELALREVSRTELELRSARDPLASHALNVAFDIESSGRQPLITFSPCTGWLVSIAAPGARRSLRRAARQRDGQ